MYRDAKEELRRLEEALLKESEEVSVAGETEEDWEDEEDYTEEKKPTLSLLTIVITLAALTLAVLIFWFVRYGRVFL